MQALHEIKGHMLALDKLLLIGPIETVSPFSNAYFLMFEVFLSGAKEPYRCTGQDKESLNLVRSELVAAYNRYKGIAGAQDEARTTGKADGLSLGEAIHLYRFRAGLSLKNAAAAAWPDLKAAHQKLKKIEAGAQAPTDDELGRLANALNAPALADMAPLQQNQGQRLG